MLGKQRQDGVAEEHVGVARIVLREGGDEVGAERLELLYRTILEANDLFRDTCGATLSVNPATGNVRLQRFDLYDVLLEVGVSKALTLFASVATQWAALVRDYRDAPHGEEDNYPDDGNLLGVRV